jgi:magnesium transporter
MANQKKGKRARVRVPRRKELAAPPGTITPDPTAPVPDAQVFSYGPVECVHEDTTSLARVRELRGAAQTTWVNVEGVRHQEFLQGLGEIFGWHPLVLEDIVSQHQRPKVEDYDDYVFIVVHMPSLGEKLVLEQLNLVLGAGWVATLQSDVPGDPFEAVRNRIFKARGRIRGAGSDYLAYALIDSVIDHYFPVVETINERLDMLESQIKANCDNQLLLELHAIRNDLHAIWRTVSATREAIGKLVRGEVGALGKDTKLFLRDCLDHCAQLLDAVGACQELSSSLMSLQQAALNNRMSETMRVLTMIATVFIPLSFIAGVYGMNFDRSASAWNMPELSWTLGYPFALGLMAFVATAFVIHFWSRGWIGGNDER